jgi:hypothetical protein
VGAVVDSKPAVRELLYPRDTQLRRPYRPVPAASPAAQLDAAMRSNVHELQNEIGGGNHGLTQTIVTGPYFVNEVSVWAAMHACRHHHGLTAQRFVEERVCVLPCSEA